MAAMASTTGTALGKTHGSWRPRAVSVVGFPSKSTVFCSISRRCHRFEGNTEIDVLTIAQTALYSAAAIALCSNTGSNILIHSSIF